MNLAAISLDLIRLKQPLPFSLRGPDGKLLAKKGFVVGSMESLQVVAGGRGELYIDVDESDNYRRAYVAKLHNLVREDQALGKIADMQLGSKDIDDSRNEADDDTSDWFDLQTLAGSMLHEANPEKFQARLGRLQRQLARRARTNPDGTLFALIYLSASEVRFYSATHSMLVSVMCSLAAREVLKWPEETQTLLGKAALTMNIGMTDLQDRLAMQRGTITPEQRHYIDQHPARSVAELQQRGITQAEWLEAVANHHTKNPGPLAERPEGLRMARIIQRADMFAARLAPRASRTPQPPASAMQACFFDETGQTDEAGAALIKTVGIYSPGSFVRLATNEIAAVIQRGLNTTMPRVAVLVNRDGMPMGEMIVRDTSQREYKIIASVPHRSVKVNINLERLLPLTRSTTADFAW